MIIGNDVIHGYRTIFPIPLAESCTWDPGLVEETARIAAEEATADGTDWTFAPMVDVSRDPAGGASPRVPAKTLSWAQPWPGRGCAASRPPT